MAGDKGLALHQLHCSHVIGLDQVFAIAADAPQAFQLGVRLQQCQGGEHHLFACIGQFIGQLQPIFAAHQGALGADGLPQVDDIHRAFCNPGIKIQHLLFGPVVENGAK